VVAQLGHAQVRKQVERLGGMVCADEKSPCGTVCTVVLSGFEALDRGFDGPCGLSP